MAIDHFEEQIAPTLKKAYCELPSRSILNTSAIQFQCLFTSFVCHIFSTLINIFRVHTYVDTPDVSLCTSGLSLSLPSFFNHLQQGDLSATSTPGRSSADCLNSNQSNYIRMDRKYKRAMRKVCTACREIDFVENNFIWYGFYFSSHFAAEQCHRHPKQTISKTTELLHTNEWTERSSSWFATSPRRND